jgi:hypothetical protein
VKLPDPTLVFLSLSLSPSLSLVLLFALLSRSFNRVSSVV